MICATCQKPVACTVDEPGFAASSLGSGTYHYDCWKAEWNRIYNEQHNRVKRQRSEREHRIEASRREFSRYAQHNELRGK